MDSPAGWFGWRRDAAALCWLVGVVAYSPYSFGVGEGSRVVHHPQVTVVPECVRQQLDGCVAWGAPWSLDLYHVFLLR